MQVNTGYANSALNTFKQNAQERKVSENVGKESKSIEKTINDAAVEVSISMNAQIVLFSMNASDMVKSNTYVQSLFSKSQDLFDFLSGKETPDGMSLANIGYTGKPITELSEDEASELINEDGFFGIKQTSDRVANFVLSFAGDDIELLKKGREGVVRGFEEALKMFGGELPEISHKTQERTLSLIDEKINSLKKD